MAGPMFMAFDEDTYRQRVATARAALRDAGLDVALVFAQETDYWLTGYDTGGFVFFQCLIVTADDRPLVLLTRRPDLIQARDTSIIDDVRLWWDADDANPARDLKAILAELGLQGSRIGIELNTHGLTGWNHHRVSEALNGWAELVDCSWLLRRLRLVKSRGEIAYVRKAAALCQDSLKAVIATARPGVPDQALKAAYLKVVLEGGGDMPANAPLFNSGRRALYGRGIAGARPLEAQDQVVVEYPVSYRRYNVKVEWPIILGQPSAGQRRLFDVVVATLAEMTAATRPGNTLGQIFAIHATRLDEAGYAKHRFGATGYSVGISFAPTSMDVPPMVYPGAALAIEPGMTLFYHIMVGDAEQGIGLGVGHTMLVTDGDPEVLNPLPETMTVIA